MSKIKYGLFVICIFLGITACVSPLSEVSGNTFSSSEASLELEEYAAGYSLEQIGLKIVFPEIAGAYPFEDHSPHMYAGSDVSAIRLRSRSDTLPSLKADMINFNGAWSTAEISWNQPKGVHFYIPVMFLQAFKKSDIDGGMKVEYFSHTRNDLCVELSKEQLMPYLWRETEEYYIIDFLDVYINNYRVFACEAALYHLDTAEYQDDTPMYLDFKTFLGKINDVRIELKDKINLE